MDQLVLATEKVESTDSKFYIESEEESNLEKQFEDKEDMLMRKIYKEIGWSPYDG